LAVDLLQRGDGNPDGVDPGDEAALRLMSDEFSLSSYF
jgi:hypothetical protein